MEVEVVLVLEGVVDVVEVVEVVVVLVLEEVVSGGGVGGGVGHNAWLIDNNRSQIPAV